MSGLTTLNNPGSSLDLPDPPTVNDATLTIQRNSTNVATFTANDADNVTANITDNDTTYTAGGGLTLSGTSFSHTDTSSQGSVNNSGSTVIQDITLDTYGHITGIGSTTISTGGGNNNTSTTAVGAYAMVGATNPTNTNVGTGTSFGGNSNTYQYAGITAGVNNYRFNLQSTGEIARNGNIPAGTWHFRGAGGQNTGRCTLCQRTA